MGLKVGEFFVELGLVGDGQATRSIDSISSKIGDATSNALWFKGSLVAAGYELGNIVAGSNKAGMELKQFNTITGLSSEYLQRVQFAGRQAGASVESTAGSFKNLQSVMANMVATGHAPAWWGVISQSVGIDQKRVRDLKYDWEKLQEYAVKMKAAGKEDFARMALGSAGLSEDVIAAMEQGAYNAQNMARAPIYSDAQRDNLARMKAQWENLGDSWDKTIGRINAKHGGQMINGLETLTHSLEHVIDKLLTLSENVKVFELVGKAFEGWATILGAIDNAVGDVNKNSNAYGGGIWGTYKGAVKSSEDFLGDQGHMLMQTLFGDSRFNEQVQRADEDYALRRTVNANKQNFGNTVQQLNQYMNFQHDGKNSKQVAADAAQAVKSAHRQQPVPRISH